MAARSFKWNRIAGSNKDYGIFILRLVIGWRLIAGTWHLINSSESMSEVKDFFGQLSLPFPLISAYITVYAQFICGILFLTGLWFRTAGLIMVINFAVAIAVYDIHHSFDKAFPAWIILAGSLFFLLNGPGKFSIERAISKTADQTGH
jgi:putative oxidoreductase